MAATFQIINRRIGEGGLKSGNDVLRLQQLLKLNNHRVHCTGQWSQETSQALLRFQESLMTPTQALFMCDGLPLPGSCLSEPRAYVLPDDTFLVHLALGAGVLLPLAAGRRGAPAFQKVHSICEDRVTFDVSPARAVYGLKHYPGWAVTPLSDTFSVKEPLALNCTLYVNLMLSVWAQGNAHGQPFDGNVQDSGGSDHFARDRYHDPLVGEFRSIKELPKATDKYPGYLFCLEAGDSVSHMALLYKGNVYECNMRYLHLGCYSSSLEDWYSDRYKVWLSGPSPN